MITILYLLAAATLPDEMLPNKTETTYFSPVWKDVFLIIGGLGVLGIVLFLWAFLTRKSHTVSSSGRSSSSRGFFSKRRKKRKHGQTRDHWQRNPTLAETGGLPPRREDDSPTP